MNRKQRGSSILLVLMVATVLVMLSSVIASGLTMTNRMNSVQKREDDLLYAAESGIDMVLTNAKKGEYASIPVETPARSIRQFDLNAEFISQQIEVEITGTVIPDPRDSSKKAIKAISISKDIRPGMNSIKEVQVIITENRTTGALSSNLLKYSICGDKVNFYITGPIDFRVANVNSMQSSEVLTYGPSIGDINSESIELPAFNSTLVPYYDEVVEINSKSELVNSPTDYIAGDLNYKGIIKKTFPFEGYDPATGTTGIVNLEIYLVNNKGLILNSLNRDIATMNYIAILATNNVTLIDSTYTTEPNVRIDKATGGPLPGVINPWPNFSYFYPVGSFNLFSSTIVGKEVNVYGAVYHVTVPTYDEADISNSILNNDRLTIVNDVLGPYLINSSGGGVAGSVPEYNITDIEYK